MTLLEVSDLDSPDYEGFGALEFFLEPQNGAFKIDEKSGVITLRTELDYETQKTWTLVSVVRDGGGKETRCHLVVDVEDANEAAPVFQQPTQVKINPYEPVVQNFAN